MLRILSAKKRQAFYRSQEKSTSTVLWEHEDKSGWMEGYTENYIRVRAPFDIQQVNELQEIYLNEIDEEGFFQIAQPKLSV
jgi:threonylcarbamoyladenosine tRNA methylthiotransferase MtaB